VGDSPLSTLARILCELLSSMREEHVRQLPRRHSFGIFESARADDFRSDSSLDFSPSTVGLWRFVENVDCRSRACRIGSSSFTNIVAE